MRHLFAPLAALLSLAAPLRAEITDTPATLEVLPGWVQEDGTRMVGFRLTMAPGWKTYWRAPGDAGIPPEVSWAGSDNIAQARFGWPVPDVFDVAGMRSIGYHDQVVLPVVLTPAAPGEPIRLAGQLDIGVCEEICVPMRLDFALDLAGEGRRDPAIVAALIDRPQTEAEAQVGDVTCHIEPDAEGLSLTTRIEMPTAGGAEVVVIESGIPEVWVSEPATTRQGDMLTATAMMIHVNGGAFAIDRSRIRMTVLGADRAVDIQGCTG